MQGRLNLNAKDAASFELLSCVKLEEFQKLVDSAKKAIGDYDQLSIGDYLHGLNGDFGFIGVDDIPTIGQYLWIAGFKEHSEAFVKVMESYNVQGDINEQKASAGLPEFSFEESVLTFCKDYFGLHNFDISAIKVWEFVLAKKDVYVKRMFGRNMERIMMQKYKTKK